MGRKKSMNTTKTNEWGENNLEFRKPKMSSPWLKSTSQHKRSRFLLQKLRKYKGFRAIKRVRNGFAYLAFQASRLLIYQPQKWREIRSMELFWEREGQGTQRRRRRRAMSRECRRSDECWWPEIQKEMSLWIHM